MAHTCGLEICPHRDCAVYYEVLCRFSCSSSVVSHHARTEEGQQKPEHIPDVSILLAARPLSGFDQRGCGICCSIPLIRCSLVGLQGSPHAHSIEQEEIWVGRFNESLDLTSKL